MGVVKVPAQAKMVSVEARVIRADGTVEDLGTVAYWHRNPLRRLIHKVRRSK
jgi:hypothetical protein